MSLIFRTRDILVLFQKIYRKLNKVFSEPNLRSTMLLDYILFVEQINLKEKFK